MNPPSSSVIDYILQAPRADLARAVFLACAPDEQARIRKIAYAFRFETNLRLRAVIRDAYAWQMFTNAPKDLPPGTVI